MGTFKAVYICPEIWCRWMSQALILLSIVFSNFASVASSSDINNNTLSPSTQVPNITVFRCEWEDLKFPITLGPAIACALAVFLGGFELFVGELFETRMLFSFIQDQDRF